MHCRLQFGMRENPAYERRHGSRVTVDIRSEGNCIAASNLLSLESSGLHAHLSIARDSAELTQSERDWVFAKRTLARGEVNCEIAGYRGNERHSGCPRYTMQKAQSEIQPRQADANDGDTRSAQEFETAPDSSNRRD